MKIRKSFVGGLVAVSAALVAVTGSANAGGCGAGKGFSKNIKIMESTDPVVGADGAALEVGVVRFDNNGGGGNPCD